MLLFKCRSTYFHVHKKKNLKFSYEMEQTMPYYLIAQDMLVPKLPFYARTSAQTYFSLTFREKVSFLAY